MIKKEKVELYKIRSLGEIFSASADFIRQNWKILLENIVYIGAPLSLIYGFAISRYMNSYYSAVFSSRNFGANMSNFFDAYFMPDFLVNMAFMFLLAFILPMFFYSMTGSLLYQYSRGKLNESTDRKEVYRKMFSFAGKIFLQGLILFGFFILLVLIFALILVPAFSTGNHLAAGIGAIVCFLILFVGLIIVFPPLCLIMYPVFFENASAWQGIKKGFRLGFKNWASVFGTVIVGYLMLSFASSVLFMPGMIYTAFSFMTNSNESGFLEYLFTTLPCLVYVVITPAFILFVGFQYTSVVEKEENISLQNNINEFDTL